MDSIQRIMQEALPPLVAERSLMPWQSYAGWHISHCRTSTFGGRVEQCPSGLPGHHHKIYYNSCRHRSCPQCSGGARHHWLAHYQQHLLPCAHRQAVFTLPHAFNPLWLHNTSWFAALLFECVAAVIKQVTRDTKNLGGEAAFSLALHTWGRDLSVHPHLHVLISEGGVDSAGVWRKPQHGTYLPAVVMMRVFRGMISSRLRTALRDGQVVLPAGTSRMHWQRLIGENYQKKWNVRVEKSYSDGAGLAKYLARYFKGGPVRSSQVRQTRDGVRLRFKSHRTGQEAVKQYSGSSFSRQLLVHSPPTGLHSVRHYGLYAGSKRRELAVWRATLGAKPSEPREEMDQEPAERPRCATCQAPITSGLLLAKRARWRH